MFQINIKHQIFLSLPSVNHDPVDNQQFNKKIGTFSSPYGQDLSRDQGTIYGDYLSKIRGYSILRMIDEINLELPQVLRNTYKYSSIMVAFSCFDMTC